MSDAEANQWHGLSIRLLQAEAISRSDRCTTPAYRTVGDTLEVSCGAGPFTAFGARLVAAGPDRARALWDGVLFELERNQDFTAVGQEPGWRLEIQQGKSFRLMYAYGEKRVTLPGVPGIRDSSGIVTYHAKTDSVDLRVVVTPASCEDAMSGKPYPSTVSIVVNGETLKGCGEPQAVLDGVRDLLPSLRERADETERLRVVPEASIKELEETGFFKLLQPRRFDGFESDPVDFYTAVRDIAGACGSTGWVSSVVGVHPWQVALFADEAQQAVWGEDTATRLREFVTLRYGATPAEWR